MKMILGLAVALAMAMSGSAQSDSIDGNALADSGLSVNPAALVFIASPGGPAQSQSLTVTVPGNAAVSASITSLNGVFFSVAASSCSGTPNATLNCVFSGTQTLTLTVNPASLATLGAYRAQMTFQSGFSTLMVPLTLNLTAPVASLTIDPATPAVLAFTVIDGAPQTRSLAVDVPGDAAVQAILTTVNGNFVTATTTNCDLNPTTPICTFTGNQTLLVTVNPAGLTAGTYNGNILLQSDGVSLNIPLTLILRAPGLTNTSNIASPASLAFAYQTSSSAAVPQQFIAVGAPGPFTTAASVSTAQQWLAASAAGSTGPSNVIVTVNPQGLPPGTYLGTIAIDSSQGTMNVTVTLTVSVNVVLEAVPGDVVLAYQDGTPAVQQNVTIVASDNSAQPVGVATSTPWIAFGALTSGLTATSAPLIINPSGLCNGLNTGAITVTSAQAANSGFTIPVTALVTGSTACSGGGGPLILAPPSLNFNAQVNGPPPFLQFLMVVVPSASTTFTVSADIPSGQADWLTVQPMGLLSGTQMLVVVANQSGLGAGTYSRTISFHTNGVVQTVPVTLIVTSPANAVLTASPSMLAFTAPSGQSAGPLNVTLSTTSGAPINIVNVSTDSPNFLSAVLTGGSTVTSASPTTLAVTASAAALPAGVFIGHVTVLASTGAAATISVTFDVTPGSTTGPIVATPSSLTFVAASGQIAPPQTVILTSAGNVPISTPEILSDEAWLTVTRTTQVPYTILVTASALSLPAGFYAGHLTINPTLPVPTVIAVTLLVQPAAGGSTITANPSSLQLTFPGSNAAAMVAIGSSNPAVTSFNSAVTSRSNWLIFAENNPSHTDFGLPLGSYLIRVDPAVAVSLPPGTYAGVVTLFNPQNPNDTTTINATLTVNGIDLAQGKAATESSTLPGYPTAGAASAVDGNTDGNFLDGSVTATNLDTNAWWQVDLGASFTINTVLIWNRTDCCGSRLNDYWVFVSNTPFLPADTPTTLQNRPGIFSSHQTNAPDPSAFILVGFQGGVGVTGRYVRVQLTGADYLSLAEVQVFGTALIGVSGFSSDLALKAAATESSTLAGFPGAAASSAVDGNLDGNFFDGSVTATNLDTNAWWQVDLGTSSSISSITIWNRTDCCGSRLNDFWVFVSDTPFLPTDTPAILQNRPGTFASHQTAAPSLSTVIAPVAQGRYVRVQLTGANYLSLAEVVVFGIPGAPPTDLALGKAATQSSTFPGYATAGAASAVDGNTDGNFGDGSVTATNLDTNPWWQVDLGASTAVASIAIWNRTDCCGSRLGDYWVFVSDTPFLATDTPTTLMTRAGTFSSHQTSPPNPSTTIPVNAQGRYVRVQLSIAGYLSLAEVQVFGQ